MCFFFFFQAEDGIRDAQESRGLGDVYKRQTYCCGKTKKKSTSPLQHTAHLVQECLTKLCVVAGVSVFERGYFFFLNAHKRRNYAGKKKECVCVFPHRTARRVVVVLCVIVLNIPAHC
eukprot:TRINITY_DN36319_c0_g1_i3.p1 TRINITY_DN36319_c0_g1~~TRINITY_DN36319_c0_g1_i3.p1  ORF type:complete len:118 (+),score=14.43 TRINITY_DN36319_c0_g1_i3:83-436(+)